MIDLGILTRAVTMVPVTGVGGVYPGCGTGGAGRVLYRVPTQPPEYPYLVIFSLKASTYGQMKVFLRYFMRFPEIGSRNDQN